MGEPWTLGGIAMLVLMHALRRRGRPPRRFSPASRPCPGRMALGRRDAAPARDPGTQAHRLRNLTPLVGYRIGTPGESLADAYAIFTSPAWRDPWLAEHQLDIDPIVEAAEILDHLRRVTALLADVHRQLSLLPAGYAAARTYRGYQRALLESLDDGLRRARALTAYREEVRLLEEVLAGSRALAEAESFGDRVLDVLSESARHELATQQLDDSREQLQALEAGLREITVAGSAPTLPAEPRQR